MATVNDPWLDAHRVDPATLASAPLIGIDHVEGEIASLVAYDYVIVNEYLPAAVEQFLTIVRSERCKVVRLRRDDLQRLLDEFGANR